MKLDRAGERRTPDQQSSDLLSRFHDATREAPDAIALHFGERAHTRADLDVASDAIAAALLTRGARDGDRIAVYLQNRPEFVIAILAAWKAGCTVVPGNPTHRVREFQAIIDDSGARIVVAQENFATEIIAAAERELDVIAVDDDRVPFERNGPRPQRFSEILASPFDTPPPRCPILADAAFITYTSGTTGKPRGAINSHGAMAFSGEVYRSWAQLSERDVILCTAPMFHITGLAAGLAAAITSRAPLVIHGRFNAKVVANLIQERGVTFMLAAITVFIAFMSDEAITRRSFATLRKVFTGGAPVAPELAHRWETMFGSTLGTGYGLTETSGPTHMSPLFESVPTDAESGAMAVGKAIPGTSVAIVRDDGSAADIGEAGEVVLAGPQIMTGYWQDPTNTALALSPSGLRTGDIGLIDEAGWLYLIDRKKDVIIASGFKVWPREVEDVLYEHPAIREAAVIGAPDPYRGETVIAYVSLRSGQRPDEAEIIEHCQRRLANYKRPKQVHYLDELPKTASGKIRRVDLRAMQQ
jgi:long-chain acyl-CoA synthetase